MKLHNNETVFDSLNPPKRHFPMRSRILALALIAISCLMIVFGLFIDRFTASNTIDLFIIPALFIFLNHFLLKSIPYQLRESIPSQFIITSGWTLKSYEESTAGLDERERQVIDQAYRTSYRITASVFFAAGSIIYVIDNVLHLAYHPGPIGFFLIISGIFGLVFFLPTAIFVWNKEV